MLLTDEQKLIQRTARDFALGYLREKTKLWDSQKEFPTDAIARLKELGFMGMLIPETYHGSNIGYIAYALAIEEIASGDASCSTIISVHNSVASLPILNYGSVEQKQTFLPALATGDMLGAFCLTEPEAGSDAANIKMQAIEQDGYFILNGTKQFITSGKHADLAIVFANTNNQSGRKNISAFIVPTSTPGYTVSRIEDKLGQHAAETAQVFFDNVQIPKNYLLGKKGEGYKIALSHLESGRIGIAAQCIGIARHAFECALSYAKERESFGKPLIGHQAIQFQLAEMATEIKAARALTLHAATLKDQNMPCLAEAAMAKLKSSEMAEKICHMAIQIYGGYGYLKDYPVEQLFRDIKVTTLYEGTSEIQKMIIGKALFELDSI